MKIKEKIINFKTGYQRFMSAHRGVDKIVTGTVETAKVGAAITFGGVTILSALAALGLVIEGCHRAHRRQVLRPDDRSATLIDHQETTRTLYFDMDGQTNTAEAVVKYDTCCVVGLEAVRQCRLGDVKKVSEWKKHLMADGCFDNQFEWTELKTKERDSL